MHILIARSMHNHCFADSEIQTWNSHLLDFPVFNSKNKERYVKIYKNLSFHMHVHIEAE